MVTIRETEVPRKRKRERARDRERRIEKRIIYPTIKIFPYFIKRASFLYLHTHIYVYRVYQDIGMVRRQKKNEKMRTSTWI